MKEIFFTRIEKVNFDELINAASKLFVPCKIEITIKKKQLTQKLETEKDARLDISHQDWANKQQERSQLKKQVNNLQTNLNQKQQAKNKTKNNLTQEQNKIKTIRNSNHKQS